ncbi:hypothetical protein [Kocuria rosea]|uniref:hypothetical protein n=1 Tax=Kocuria rosea TaxID=1275 RepID=UPI00232C01C7|nr:hypothetical protein [Kocuria rosea]
MSTFKPLPAHQAQALGQLVAATLDGVGNVALSEDALKPPTWQQLMNLRNAACKTPTPDTALSSGSVKLPAPRWETSAPAKKAPTRLVMQESPQKARARKIAEHEAIQRFESKYGVGATLEDAREQDLTDDYLDRMGLGR